MLFLYNTWKYNKKLINYGKDRESQNFSTLKLLYIFKISISFEHYKNKSFIMNPKLSLQRKATIISSCTAFVLMLIKFAVWIFSGSIAVLSSAVDSLMDMFVSFFNNFAVYLSEKKPNKKFNYWRWKIEAMASFFEWLVITASWCYIFYESIRKLIVWEQIEYIWISVIVMLISVIITACLVVFLNYIVKKTDNLVIKSDELHYRTDLFSNTWILFWLAIIHFTWFHHIDGIIGILVAFYIVYEAFELIQKWFLLLMDVALDKEEVSKIRKIINNSENICSFHDLKTRQSWQVKFVEVDLVFNDKIILQKAHDTAEYIEKQIKKIDENYSREVTIHMDPSGECKMKG